MYRILNGISIFLLLSVLDEIIILSSRCTFPYLMYNDTIQQYNGVQYCVSVLFHTVSYKKRKEEARSEENLTSKNFLIYYIFHEHNYMYTLHNKRIEIVFFLFILIFILKNRYFPFNFPTYSIFQVSVSVYIHEFSQFHYCICVQHIYWRVYTHYL